MPQDGLGCYIIRFKGGRRASLGFAVLDLRLNISNPPESIDPGYGAREVYSEIENNIAYSGAVEVPGLFWNLSCMNLYRGTTTQMS